MGWQADHSRLRDANWRRGRDGLWRRTPEIGGSFLTRNAMAITQGVPIQQVVAASRERHLQQLSRRKRIIKRND